LSGLRTSLVLSKNKNKIKIISSAKQLGILERIEATLSLFYVPMLVLYPLSYKAGTWYWVI
jgi:hypothetical protein